MRWTCRMYEQLLVLDGKPARLARTPGRRRARALATLARTFPDVTAARAALAALQPAGARRRRWSDAEIASLRELFPSTSTPELAARLRRSRAAIEGKAALLGLRRTAEHRRRVWRAMGDQLAQHPRSQARRFRKGNVPWTAGLKGYDAGGRSHATRFRPGHKPHTWAPIGTESTTDGYRVRKIRDRGRGQWDKWRFVHHLVWEQATGRKVPKGGVIAFKNGDRRDLRPENLELITRRQLMARNTIHNYPEQLKGAILALAKLRRLLREKERTS